MACDRSRKWKPPQSPSAFRGVPSQFQVEVKTTEARAESEPKMLGQTRWITPDYFSVLHMRVIAGELCRNRVDSTTVMVNRSFAELYLSGSTAIGRHLFLPGNSFLSAAEVRGVVGDARETGIDHEPQPTVYWCDASLQPGMFFLVRTRGEPGAMTKRSSAGRSMRSNLSARYTISLR